MSQTVNVYKENQAGILNLLQRLERFVNSGKEFEIEFSESVRQKIAHAINETSRSKLKIALVGGFSEGKTSIAAAWLGRVDKTSMKISASESSDAVSVYNIDNECVLIDTPGLFGFEQLENQGTHEIEKYKEITKKFLSDANIVLYVMNPVVPVKESHNEDIVWMFKTLNLLPRTVFVLGRFDEVADVEDEAEYQKFLAIKRQIVIDRLTDFLKLGPEASNKIDVVAVSSDPFEQGIEYWLKNPVEFNRLSHMSLLQEATRNSIQRNGGFSDIIIQTQKSIIGDILNKHMSSVDEKFANNNDVLSELKNIYESLNKELKKIESSINDSRISLLNFFKSYFSDLALQATGTDMNTIETFLIREVGNEGCLISAEINKAFQQASNDIQFSYESAAISFSADVNSFDTELSDLKNKTAAGLLKNIKLNNTMIFAGRDAIKSAGNFLGLGKGFNDILKFKPYGAINLAEGLNGAFAFIGIGLEAWNTYDNIKRKELFDKAKKQLIEDMQKQQKDIIALMNASDFAEKFFPPFTELKSSLEKIDKSMKDQVAYLQRFAGWRNEIKNIDMAFKQLSGAMQ